jgi:hypothetical protein
MSLENELDDILALIDGHYEHYCFFVGKLYKDDAERLIMYRGYRLYYNPLCEEDYIYFATSDSWFLSSDISLN